MIAREADLFNGTLTPEKTLLRQRIEPTGGKPITRNSAYFWGHEHEQADREPKPCQPVLSHLYTEERKLLGLCQPEDFARISNASMILLSQAFQGLKDPQKDPDSHLVNIELSPELHQWRDEQHQQGKVLPSKGYGITMASNEVINIVGAKSWPKPLLTNNALFGCAFINMLNGAYDAETLFSNCCCEMAFYWEHGYQFVFPEFTALLNEAANDPRAMKTIGGVERRIATKLSIEYIKMKAALEEEHKADLSCKTLKLNREEAMNLFFCESSILGMAVESMVRGFDPGATMNDFILSCPGTDILDVGSDFFNSETANSFLNTADITKSGVITEENLKRVYEAYAHSSAMTLTRRWAEPNTRTVTILYTWHIQNNRHGFFRRALLGYSKVSQQEEHCEQREAEFCEAFDENFHTTGFSRPLEGACDGLDACDQVRRLITSSEHGELWNELWWVISAGPLEYVKEGTVKPELEEEYAERSRIAMAKAYSLGLIDGINWLTGHATHHAWQVNRLYEAAMWGSLLDDGGMRYKLDRKER